jgi:hypothetical protein
LAGADGKCVSEKVNLPQGGDTKPAGPDKEDGRAAGKQITNFGGVNNEENVK